MMTKRKVTLYIATSLDGYIAQPNDDLSFLSIVEQEGEDYGYSKFIKTVDTIILGRKTFDWITKQVPEYIHKDKKTYVITRTAKENIGNITFYTEDLTDLISELKNQSGKNIFIDGGAEIVNLLLQNNLIDEFIISIIPILVGDGIQLFKNGRPQQELRLLKAKTFKTGLVQLHYTTKN